jgi:hypothetical protein
MPLGDLAPAQQFFLALPDQRRLRVVGDVREPDADARDFRVRLGSYGIGELKNTGLIFDAFVFA